MSKKLTILDLMEDKSEKIAEKLAKKFGYIKKEIPVEEEKEKPNDEKNNG